MPRIIDLNELVGEDVIFVHGQPPREYRIPGDIDVETVFELFSMYKELGTIEADTFDEIAEEVRSKFFGIRDRLLALFQIRDPKLARLPFGPRAMGLILRSILGGLGLAISEDPPEPPAKEKRRSTAAKKSRASSSGR